MCFFEDNHCLIKDATRQDLFKVQMRGKSFSLDLFQEELTSQGILKMQKSEMEDDPPIKAIDYSLTYIIDVTLQYVNLLITKKLSMT